MRQALRPGRLVYIGALFLCVMVGTYCHAQIGFEVAPARLYFNPKEQGEQSVRLHLTNTSDTRLVLQADCADWRRDSTGTKVYYPPGSLATSCCAFINVSPSVIELAPGEKRDVLVTLLANRPRSLTAVHNGMLLLTQSNEQEVARLKGASQFIIKAQIGVHLYVLPHEAGQPDIAITGMNVTKSGEQYLVRVRIHNQGGTLLESQLRMEYLNMDTMEEIKAEPVPVNTMPNDAINLIAAVPAKLSTGKCLIVAVLDSGPTQALKVAELETVLK